MGKAGLDLKKNYWAKWEKIKIWYEPAGHEYFGSLRSINLK